MIEKDICSRYSPSKFIKQAGYGGSITGNGSYTVSATAPGYVIDSLWVDGVEVASASGLATYEVTTASKSIFATFAYTVNFNQPTGGTLNVASATGTGLTSGSIIHGGDRLTIKAQAASGYVLQSLTVNGVDVTSGYHNGYTYTAGTLGTYRTLGNGSSKVATQGAQIVAAFAQAGTSSTGGSGGSTPTTPTYNADVSGTGMSGTALPVIVNTNSGNAVVDLGTLSGNVFNGEGTTVINMPSIPGVNNYTLGIPIAHLTTPDGKGTLTFNTDTGSITLPADMLAGIPGAEGKKAGITISQGAKSSLPDSVKAAIGDRPLIQLAVTIDGKQIKWNNPNAPVTISIPYTPTAAELADPEHIVIWYIDGAGNVVSVPSGRYDAETGTVTFTITHFSQYSVAYVHKTFSDLGSVEWARKSIEVMASKGIINGTGTNTYSPAANISRADYLVLLIKILGLTAEFNSNFNDVQAGAYYYEAVGIAKKLGITEGSGDNRFRPQENISRQDMMVLTARALEKYKGLKAAADFTALDKFKDKADIAGYAAGSLATLVKEGLITGSGVTINPRANTTRAEAAVFLYRIYGKYL